MQTGYDNFWIYQNNRHKPVLLSQNDNYIYPVLTDSYKQMPNGGCPSHKTVTPVNNVASSCQNSQYKAGPQCTWPSSVHSLPFNSSYANNFHPQVRPSQTNNFSYSFQHSHAQQNFDVGNCVFNVPQKSKNNNRQNVTTMLPQNSNHTDKETARIRVKDVFSLNSTPIYNSLLENKKNKTLNNNQYEYHLSYLTSNCNRTCDFERNLSMSNYPPSSYIQREQQFLNDQQQFFQYSGTFSQQNSHLSTERQFQLNDSRKVEGILHNTLNGNNEPVRRKRTDHSNYLKQGNVHINTETTHLDYHDLSEVNKSYENYNINNLAQSQKQVTLPDINQESSLIQNYSIESLKKRQKGEQPMISNAKNFPNNRGYDFQSNLVKITIPHTGQTTYINPNELTNANRNCDLSLRTLLKSSDKVFHDECNKKNSQNHIKDNETALSNQQVTQMNNNASVTRNNCYSKSPHLTQNDCISARNSDCSYCKNIMTLYRNQVISSQSFQPEVVDDSKLQKSQKALSQESILENSTTNICSGTENIMNTNPFNGKSHESKLLSIEETTLNSVTVKQEISDLKINHPNTQLDQNIPIDQIFEEIKVEESSEEFSVVEFRQELQPSESPTAVEETFDIDKVRDSALVSKNFEPESKITSDDERKVENYTPELKKSEITPSGKENVENNMADQEKKLKKAKTCVRERSYKSKINRDKLDLLIQFLKKDDVSESKTPEEDDQTVCAKQFDGDSKKKEEVNMSRSRRKLNKASIVRNKNNSREMVSLMSHKAARAEILQDSSKSSKSTKANGKSNTDEERKNNCSNDITAIEKYIDVTEKQVKSYNPQESEKQNKTHSKSEAEVKNLSVSKQTQENSIEEEEKNIINIMQALQNLKSHFCMSCTLVSSIESFWVNVVSGELRCLNCFKKMTSKTDKKNILKLQTASFDRSNSEIKSLIQEEVPKRNEIKGAVELEIRNKSDKSKCEHASEKSKDRRTIVKQDTTESVNETTKDKIASKNNQDLSCSCKSKKKEINVAEKTLNASRKNNLEDQEKLKNGESEEKSEKSNELREDCALEIKDLDESSGPEIKTKRKHSTKEDAIPDKTQNSGDKPMWTIKRSNFEERHVIQNSPTVDHSKQLSISSEMKSEPKEDICLKARVSLGDDFEKEKHPSIQSLEKSTPKQPHDFLNTQNSKESLEQKTKGNSEKSVKQSESKEDFVSEGEKKDKKQPRDSSQSRKRSGSKEDGGSHKIRMLEEPEMDDSAVKSPSRESFDFYKFHTAESTPKRGTNELMDKSKLLNSPSKESYTDHKVNTSKHLNPEDLLENSEKKNMFIHKNIEKGKIKESVDQIKRRKSGEKFFPLKIRIVEEPLKDVKFTKQYFDKSKGTVSPKAEDAGFKNKTLVHTKHFNIDVTSTVPIKSNEESFSSKEHSKNEMKNLTESPDKMRRNSISEENISTGSSQQANCFKNSGNELKCESFISGNNGKEKIFLEKIPKTSHKHAKGEMFPIIGRGLNNFKHQKAKKSRTLKALKEDEKSGMKFSKFTQKCTKKDLNEDRHKHRELVGEKITKKKKN